MELSTAETLKSSQRNNLHSRLMEAGLSLQLPSPTTLAWRPDTEPESVMSEPFA